eukprot:Cvel_29138.t1-p1 / transcript=Cvel_29138.t1 / gene=Cvel_29138 / organism=Chromera_velia_CCMP2878 / gene_product=Protein rough sheath 2, putative / transcript_product=Protein rough sheath 2, putative / location=Cvel_scaffold3937:1-2575(-) / protein_length=394 / sequence_SO=supercontig / SO=protein_coding / is_pseudo=false
MKEARQPGRKWTPDEDARLEDVMKGLPELTHGNIDWKNVAQLMQQSGIDRTARQCKDRWKERLDPHVHRGEWTEQEDYELLKLQMENGNKWKQISEKIQTGRTTEQVKNRFHYLKRKAILILKEGKKTPNLSENFIASSEFVCLIEKVREGVEAEREKLDFGEAEGEGGAEGDEESQGEGDTSPFGYPPGPFSVPLPDPECPLSFSSRKRKSDNSRDGKESSQKSRGGAGRQRQGQDGQQHAGGLTQGVLLSSGCSGATSSSSSSSSSAYGSAYRETGGEMLRGGGGGVLSVCTGGGEGQSRVLQEIRLPGGEPFPWGVARRKIEANRDEYMRPRDESEAHRGGQFPLLSPVPPQPPPPGAFRFPLQQHQQRHPGASAASAASVQAQSSRLLPP